MVVILVTGTFTVSQEVSYSVSVIHSASNVVVVIVFVSVYVITCRVK